MGDNEASTDSEKVLILPLSEDSKRITQILSNEKAMKMLEVLADKPMSASDVAEKLELPLTTVKYNLDGLIEADLIKVRETKWSRKGREVKIYEPVQKLIVVAPGGMKNDRSSILSMLKKYLGLVAGALFAATGLEALTRGLSMGSAPLMAQDATTAPMFDEEGTVRSMTKDSPREESVEEMAPGEGIEETGLPEMQSKEIPEAENDNFSGYTAEEEEGPEPLFDEQATMEGMDEYEVPAEPAGSEGIPIEETAPETLASSTPNGTDAGTEVLRESVNTTGNQTHTLPFTEAVADNVSTVTEPASGIFQQGILSHVSVWFFFGCLFVIALLFVREIYNRKKNI